MDFKKEEGKEEGKEEEGRGVAANGVECIRISRKEKGEDEMERWIEEGEGKRRLSSLHFRNSRSSSTPSSPPFLSACIIQLHISCPVHSTEHYIHSLDYAGVDPPFPLSHPSPLASRVPVNSFKNPSIRLEQRGICRLAWKRRTKGISFVRIKGWGFSRFSGWICSCHSVQPKRRRRGES